VTAEFMAQDACIGDGLVYRCADCERVRPLEADGRCGECLHFRAVPAVSHKPRPEYRVRYTDWRGQPSVVDLVQIDALMRVLEWHPQAKVSRLSLDGAECPLVFSLAESGR